MEAVISSFAACASGELPGFVMGQCAVPLQCEKKQVAVAAESGAALPTGMVSPSGDTVSMVVSDFAVKLCTASVVDSGFTVKSHADAGGLGFRPDACCWIFRRPG